jgi:hypothetical protein
MKRETQEFVSASLDKLEGWIEQNGWAGYDPYDLLGTFPFDILERQRLGRYLNRAVSRYAPTLARRAFGIRPQLNAKAVALLTLGYLSRFDNAKQEFYRAKAQACLQWLEEHICLGYAGACWGYPFNWQSRIKIPAGTPSSVVSSIAGLAFLEGFRVLHERNYLNIAESIAQFFLHDLNVDWLDIQRSCFSYTPLDHFHVHNANLFVAAHLHEVGVLTDNITYVDEAERAVNYTLSHQNEDGSWYYWGPPDKMLYKIDHYHTGFVLRCLDRLCRIAKRQDWENALDRGFQYYIMHLLDPSGLSRLTPDNPYPVDIHSCAEAILCLTQLKPRYQQAEMLLLATTTWTLHNMQASDGHFYYRKYPNRKVKVAYMRWGQAWMFWALAQNLHMAHMANRKKMSVTGTR